MHNQTPNTVFTKCGDAIPLKAVSSSQSAISKDELRFGFRLTTAFRAPKPEASPYKSVEEPSLVEAPKPTPVSNQLSHNL